MKGLKDSSLEEKRECPNCRVLVRVDRKFCYKCGQRLGKEITTTGSASSNVKERAIVLLPASPDTVSADILSVAQEAFHLPPGPVVALLAHQQNTKALSELCVDLGAALL